MNKAMNDIGMTRITDEERSFRPLSSAAREVNFRDIFRKIMIRKWVLISTVLLITAVTGILLFSIAPRYTAQTTLIVEPREEILSDLKSVLSNLSTDAETIRSEISIITSRDLAEKVVDQLKLDLEPEFNEALKPKSALAETFSIKNVLGNPLFRRVFGLGEEEPVSEEKLKAREQVAVIDKFLERLETFPLPGSRVISIQFTSENPELAAEITNLVANIYILDQLEAKYEATRKATLWLNNKIEGLRTKVEESDNAVEAYRKQAGLLEGTGGPLVSQQISALNAQMIVAKTSRAEAEARLSQVQQLIRSSGGATSAAEVLQSPIIQSILAQETEVKRKVAELSGEYGDRHPRLINARAELKDLQAKMAGEVNKIVQALRNEVGVARAREASLRKSLVQLEGSLAQSNSAEVQLHALQREAEADKTMLESFLARFEETSAQMDVAVNQPDARIISRAVVPNEPSFPPKKVILVIALMGSTLIGLLLIFVIEQMDSGFRSTEQIEEVTGVRVLGLVPLLSDWGGAGKSPANYILKHPVSMFSESIRSLYTSILTTRIDSPPKKILITSSQPNEGKTSIALCMARSRALAGYKTVLVEADLRRPVVYRLLKSQRKPGLVELMLGKAELADVLFKDEASGAYVIPAGGSVPDPTAILSSQKMKQLLDVLEKEFETIILDSPPVMAASDARILGTDVDLTVFVVRWAKTSREVASLGLRQIVESGGHLGGVVLSLVDPKKHARYGSGDSGYYHSSVRKYYTT
jgi:polysaccharide biosynthesis transport protein